MKPGSFIAIVAICASGPGGSGGRADADVGRHPCSPNPCQNGGTCKATGSTRYSCTCASGYSGTDCETPFDCGALSPPASGTVTAATTTLGATATYACN